MIAGPLFEHFIVSNDLVLGFLERHHIAKLVGLRCLPLAYDFRVGFKQTQQFVWKLRDPPEYPRLGLPHHPTHLIRHRFQSFPESLYTPSPAGRQYLDFLQHAAGIVKNLPRQAQQLLILSLPFSFTIGPFVAHCLSDSHHPLAHTPRPIANFALQPTRLPSDLFHGPCPHPRAVVQQPAVGRIVNIGFYHRGVHPHLSPLNHSSLLSQRHDSRVQLRDGLRTDHLSQPYQRLGIRHFFHSYPTETAIDHVGSHFPLQNFVTPVAHMLQNQHP